MKNTKNHSRKNSGKDRKKDIQIPIIDLEEDAIHNGTLEDNLIRQVEDPIIPELFVPVEPSQKTYSKKKKTRTSRIIGENREEKKRPKRKKGLTSQKKKKRRNPNRQFAKMTYAFVALFLCLMGYMVYFQVARAGKIVNSPYNARTNAFAEHVVKGDILDEEGNVLATTESDENGNEYRNYPYADLYAHVVGYDVHGKSGMESENNFDLLTSNASIIEKLKNEFQNKKNPGDTVVTTLNTTLQQAAFQALGDQKGAVVILEASTGKVLTLVSKPSFDPNQLEANWDFLTTDENSSLLNRGTQGAYAPGSTFKIVTALEYMREHVDFESYTYECSGSITHGDTSIQCYNGIAHGTEDLRSSFANSCNSSFANIGLGLDKLQYQETAKELLFNKSLPGPFSAKESSFKVNVDTIPSEMMMTAMGQGETQVSPYHMALIVSAIANNGNLMNPYLVKEIRNDKGVVVKKKYPANYGKLLTDEEAATLQNYMQAVVLEGTGLELSGRNYTVAGKTGTAEYSTDASKSHSWFVGYTDVENPDLVIAVVVESADDSGVRATAVTGEILDTYYGR